MAGACRWDYYEGRDDFDSPQRIRKRGSSGKALYLFYFPFNVYYLVDYGRHQEDVAIGLGGDTETGSSHSRRRDFSAEGVPGKVRFRN